VNDDKDLVPMRITDANGNERWIRVRPANAEDVGRLLAAAKPFTMNVIGAWNDAEPMTEGRLAEIRRRYDNGEPEEGDVPALFAEIYRSHGESEQEAHEVCENCKNWMRWPSTDGVESQSGSCEEFARDGLDCPMFATEFCSRWKPRN
jgi:hypothetical protein